MNNSTNLYKHNNEDDIWRCHKPREGTEADLDPTAMTHRHC